MDRRKFVGAALASIGVLLFSKKSKNKLNKPDKDTHTSKKIGRLCDNPYDQSLSPELRIRGCLFSDSGRGDCEHFVGLPEIENEFTTDIYGRPHGWCEICWRGEENKRLKGALFQNANNYGGEKYALSIVSDAIKNKCLDDLGWL